MARGNRPQGLFLLLWQVAMLILYFLFVDYEPHYDAATGEGKNNNIARYYLSYSHVATMALVGFGFLMTFIRRYRFGAVGYTFLVTVMIFQWSILTLGFWERVQNGKWTEKIHVSLVLIIDAIFAACSCLIALGGMIGKVSVWQFLFLSFWQTIFYSANYILGSKTLKVVDIGGSMYIHLFGAYWGLAATYFMNPSDVKKKVPYQAQGASYSSDTFSMIGTFFLWLLWPSFNGALALPDVQARVFLNTVLSLTGSAMVTFGLSVILRHDGKFCMEDIQNATLAGGVAIGAVADLYVTPGGAMIVGCFAGIISVFGFSKLSPFIFKYLGLHDSCGIHNLHGMTGILGGITSAIVTSMATPERYGAVFNELLPRAADGDQWKYQLACLGHSLAISLVGGAIFGFLTKKIGCLCQPHVDDEFMFDDRHAFEVPESPVNEIQMSEKPHV